jgi:type VI protein secretion system component VasK
MVVAADFGTGEVFLSMLWFFLFVIWFWLIIAIFSDIFRSHDMSGWAKAAWSIFVIVLPFIGIFTYLIARGGKMTEHAVQDSQAQEDYFNARVKSAVGTNGNSEADQLATLSSLHDQGVIDDTEFAKMKAKVVA